MQKIQFEDAQWPIVVVRYPSRIDPRDWDEHLERVIGYVKRDQPWGMINDSRRAASPTAKQRQGIAAFYDAYEPLVRANWRGTAVISDSSLIVGVLTAITWLRPAPHPFRAFSDFAEGERWLRGMFKPAELPAFGPLTPSAAR